VVEHRLPPGAKLTEDQLGAIFGASRTTVRSALQALAHGSHRHAGPSSQRRSPKVSARRRISFSVPTDTLVRYHPEWEGPLMGDKTRPALFDNAKVKRVAGDFARVKELKDVLAEPIAHIKARLRSEGPQTGELDALIDRIAREQRALGALAA
jgi:Bacterial regulatory proteins, gntR family